MIVEFTAAALADLQSIGDYIAQDNPSRAVSFVQDLSRSCMDIGDMPLAWPIVPRYEHLGIRRRVHGRYLIFYSVAAGRITIIHVFNGAMGIDALMFPDG